MELSFERINVTLGKTPILRDVSLRAAEGRITGIIGPNGSGKSTLIKTLFGIVKRDSGQIFLDGAPVGSYPKDFLASHIGYVSQETDCPFDFTVREMVAMGLYPRGKTCRGGQREAALQAAMEQTGIAHLGERSFLSLSGGEKKTVMLARAIAQQVETLVLDEPTNHLDIRHQLFILEFLREKRFTSLIALHDLNFACMYCDTLFLLENGQVAAQGAPMEVLTPENVRRVFGVNGCARLQPQGACRFFLENGCLRQG